MEELYREIELFSKWAETHYPEWSEKNDNGEWEVGMDSHFDEMCDAAVNVINEHESSKADEKTIASLVGCICIKKTVVRVGLGIIGSLGLILATLIGCLTYTARYRINSVDSSVSQDGKYELLFQQIGDPDWPFGSTHARLILKDESGTIVKYSFDVANSCF